MDSKIEFNWALKLKPENGLDESLLREGEIYNFTKSGNRVYPLNIPIDLINQDWVALARVIVIEYTNKENIITGRYRIVRIYNEEERRSITDYWKKDLQTLKDIGAVSS
tara:strand:- start:1121 stop:1447 length:327 start_codon:yes stop_codon:yes gene_type:complete